MFIAQIVENKDNMKNLTVIAVAFAAGLISFAAHAEAAAETDSKATVENTKVASAEIETTASIGAKRAKPYGEIVSRYAASYGVPVNLAHAVISVESNYRPNTRGKAGEIGLMQIKPATARMMGYSGSAKGLFNPETNIKFGMMYLAKARQLSGGTTCGTILKYNAGHGAKRMNPVSAAYCKKVQARLGS